MTNWQRLLRLIYDSGFAQRYRDYDFGTLAARPSTFPPRSRDADQKLEEILKSTGMNFQFFRSERFFRYQRKPPPCDIKLHLSNLGAAIELLLYVQFPDEHILGGHFAALVEQSFRQCEPHSQLEPSPGHLFFDSDEALVQHVGFSLDLFAELERAILAENGWLA